jgi:hypothetical protein
MNAPILKVNQGPNRNAATTCNDRAQNANRHRRLWHALCFIRDSVEECDADSGQARAGASNRGDRDSVQQMSFRLFNFKGPPWVARISPRLRAEEGSRTSSALLFCALKIAGGGQKFLYSSATPHAMVAFA